MTPQHLQALRRLLHFSAPEAARWIAADPDRPRGVDERTWNRWEAGARPVPPNISARMLDLVAWRAQALAQARQALATATDAEPARLVWYEDPDDWPDDRAHWRPAQSVAAALLAELGPARLQLLPFDPRAFRAWLAAQPARLADDSRTRASWAAQAQAPGADGPAGGAPAAPAAPDPAPHPHPHRVGEYEHPHPPDRGIRTQVPAAIVIPPGASFGDLKLARSPKTGRLSFDAATVQRICDASNIDPDVMLRGPEDRLAALVVTWYAQHLAAGGAPCAVAEDLMARARAAHRAGASQAQRPGPA